MDKKRNGKSSDLLRRALAMLLALICSVYMLPGPALAYAVGETAAQETVTNESADETAEGTDDAQNEGDTQKEEDSQQAESTQKTDGETAGQTDDALNEETTDDTVVEEDEELEEEPTLLKAPMLGATSDSDKINMKDKGINVNFFDYTTSDTLDKPGDWGHDYNSSINSDKTLHFYHNGIAGNGYNNWTGSPNYDRSEGAAANQGIVQNKLVDGYPVLAVGGRESLKYLFDPKTAESNRKDYLGIDGLLYKVGGGSSQYKVGYRCLENYATLNSNKTFDFSDVYYCDGSEASGPIGFFPFNAPNPDNKSVEGGSYYNHHFGMTMEADFALNETKTLGGEDMTFEFAGDDDMWVFIDGVLVLDIGGIHQPVAGKIDFKNGTVSMREAPIYDGQHQDAKIMSAVKSVGSSTRYQDSEGRNSYYYDTNGNLELLSGDNMTLEKIFARAGETWNNDPYVKHTIQAFYLERGGMYSNLDISMNLLTTKDIEVEKEIVNESGAEVTDLSNYYASDNDTYRYLPRCHRVEEITERYDVTEEQASALLAAMELGKRIIQSESLKAEHIVTPGDAAQFIMGRLRHETHEKFLVILLNTKNKVTDLEH